MPLLTDEEIAEARSAAQKEIGFGQTSKEDSEKSVFSAPAISFKKLQEETKKNENDPNLSKIFGGAAGAAVPLSGLGEGLKNRIGRSFQAKDVYKPAEFLTPAQVLNQYPYENADLQERIKELQRQSKGIPNEVMDVSPVSNVSEKTVATNQAPQGGLPVNNQPAQTSSKGVLLTPKPSLTNGLSISIAPNEGGLPNTSATETVPDAATQRANEIAAIEKKIRDDANAKIRPPGEMNHNAEQNRIRLATEQSLGQPGASGQIVGAGSMRWDPVTQTYVPPSVIDERIKKQATTEYETNKKTAEDAQAKKDADAAEKKRVADAAEQERIRRETASLELQEAEEQFKRQKAQHETDVKNATEESVRQANENAKTKNALTGKISGGLNLGLGILGGINAGEHSKNAFNEIIKNDFTPEAYREIAKAGTSMATTFPYPLAQVGGHGIDAIMEMRKNGMTPEAISSLLMAAGTGAMSKGTLPALIGGGLTALTGAAIPPAVRFYNSLTNKSEK
jgi:hypothetical protein